MPAITTVTHLKIDDGSLVELQDAGARANIEELEDTVDEKLDVNQGAANAGKYLKIDSGGNIIPDSVNTISVVSKTISASGWDKTGGVFNVPATITLTGVTGVTASNNVIITAPGNITEEQYLAMKNAQIVCTAQGSGTISLKCFGNRPTVDLPILVMIVG